VPGQDAGTRKDEQLVPSILSGNSWEKFGSYGTTYFFTYTDSGIGASRLLRELDAF